MVTSDYRPVQHSFDRDEEQAALFSLLDPRQGSECLGLFLNPDCVRAKSPGYFLCEACSNWCLDPDCRAPNRNGLAAKLPSQEWCRDCLEYIQRLDMPCGNRVKDLPGGGFVRVCHDGFCNDRRNSAKQNGWSEYAANAHCFGLPGDEVPRTGFFVYELTSDYVGMTYNPSERQEEHRIRRYVSWQEQHGHSFQNREQYIRRAIQNEANEFTDKYEQHWRSRRTHQGRERLLRWLSPVFEDRIDVYRAEWALKAYSFWRGGHRPEYERVRSVSSLPELVLDSAGFFADECGQARFKLAWRLSETLGPSQIVPVDHYELEYRTADQNIWMSVGPTILPSERNGFASYDSALENSVARSWRVRGISGGKFPGPWAVLSLTDAELSEALTEIVGISGIDFHLQSRGNSAVEVSWITDNHLDGLQFVVERRDTINGGSVEMRPSTSPFVDDSHPEHVGRFSYRIRCTWKGVLSAWVSDSRSRTVVVGGPTPGEVRSLSYKIQADGTRLIDWLLPEWQGHASITHYEAELYSEHWISLGVVETAAAGGLSVVDDTELITTGLRYRVRAINDLGAGPWAEVDVPESAVVEYLREYLKIEALLVYCDDAEKSAITLEWEADELLGNVGFEIERTCGNTCFRENGLGNHYVDTVDRRPGEMYFYRARATLSNISGEWSDYVGVVVENASTYKVIPPGGELKKLVVLDLSRADDGNSLSTFETVMAPQATVTSSRVIVHEPTVLKYAAEIMSSETEIVVLISNRNQGGVEAIWNGIRCFVPSSLLATHPSLEQRVGQFARFNIKEVDNRQLVLTELKVLERLKAQEAAEFTARQQRQMEIARSVTLAAGDKVQISTFNQLVEGIVHSIVFLEHEPTRKVAVIDRGDSKSSVLVPFELWQQLKIVG